MKRFAALILSLLMLLPLAACGNSEIDESISPSESAYQTRTKFSYPEEFDPSYPYSMENILRDTNELYAAITKAFPDRPVLTIILDSYGGNSYPLELNDAVNVWLEENGYGFALMIYAFGDAELRSGKTFEHKVNEYIKAGGRCDVIAAGANILNLVHLPGDTLWDYVNDGIIVSLDSVAKEGDFDSLRELYGEAFLQRNTHNGNIYGFSSSSLEGAEEQGYLAVCDAALPYLEGLSTDELINAVMNDRELLDKMLSASGAELAIGMEIGTTPSTIFPSMFLNENYVSVNLLPLYIDKSGDSPSVVGIWEVPGFWEGVGSYIDLVHEGYMSITADIENSAMFFIRCYSDIECAQSYIDSVLEVKNAKRSYTLIPLHPIVEAAGPECSMFLASSSEQKQLALDFIFSALTDENLGRVLSMGIENVSYVIEDDLANYIIEPMYNYVYPNSYYNISSVESSKDLSIFSVQSQKNADFSKYENFNADLSGCEEEAATLALWNEDYQTALQIFGEHNLEFFGIYAESFYANRKVPEIENLRASILAQLEEYEKYYQ